MNSLIGIILIILLVLVICVGMRLASKNSNIGNTAKKEKDWNKIAEDKWNKIQSDIARINEIHDKAWGNKKVGWSEKKTLEETKRSLGVSKTAYNGYISFCQLKKVNIPEERLEYELTIAEAEDALNDPKHAIDNSLERASKTYDEVYVNVNDVGERLFETRESIVDTIEDIEKFINSIAKCPKSFEKDFKDVALYKEQFKGTVEFALEQKKVLETSAISVGAGVATGGAVAAMAPTAAMWVATTFGTASTGTAISALSGAAATNAALAWLGGGAIAASGGGMAAGQALLALAGPVGWGIAGTSVLAGVLFAWRKKIKAEENKKNEIIRMKNCTFSLRQLKAKMASILIQTENLDKKIKEQKMLCNKLSGKDYSTFTEEQKHNLGALVNNTKALAALLCEVIE